MKNIICYTSPYPPNNQSSLQSYVKALNIWNVLMASPFKIKHDSKKYPDQIFLFRDNRYWFDYNTKNRVLWCSDNLIWKVFETECLFKHGEIQSFIKNRVEEYFKQKLVTPWQRHFCASVQVEEYFKQKPIK